MNGQDAIQLVGAAGEKYMTDAVTHARVDLVRQLLERATFEKDGSTATPEERQFVISVAAVTLLMFPPAGDQMPVGVALDSAAPGEELRVLLSEDWFTRIDRRMTEKEN